MKRPEIMTPKRIPILLAAGFFCIAGCVHDHPAERGEGGSAKVVRFTLNIPVFGDAGTRSIEGANGEAAVSEADILVFDKYTDASTPLQLLGHYKATGLTQSASDPYYAVSFTAEIPAIANAGNIAIIANASDEVDAAVAAGPSKPAILAALQFHTTPVGTAYNWKADPSDYTPIPMYAEINVNGITQGMLFSGIELERMAARIDVQNKVNGSVFKLEEIYVANYHAGGYVAPVWNASTGVPLVSGDTGYPYDDYGDPPIPAAAMKPAATQDAAMKYPYSQNNSSAGPLLEGRIYACEEPANDPGGRICLVLKGIYDGADNYYPVFFTTDKEGALGPAEVINIPLHRNRKYVVTVTAAEGPGYGTFAEAVTAETVLSNLKTTIFTMDIMGSRDVVYDGQYYIAVDQQEKSVLWGESKTTDFIMSSNYTGAWSAEILDAAGSAWITFGGGTPRNGTGMDGQRLSFDVTAIDSFPGEANMPAAHIRVTAGRLVITLTVNRTLVTPLFARSNVVLLDDSGGKRLSFAVTQDENNNGMPAHSQGVFFKWGSLIGIGPAGNPYEARTHIIYNPTNQNPAGWGDGLAGWDKIPYAHTDFGFPATSSQGEDYYDEFAEYNGKLGYGASDGIGDVCRYVSSTFGKAKWVSEGSWRMPTWGEYRMLYAETGNGKTSWGNFADTTSSLDPSTDQDGLFNPLSGLWFGTGAGSVTPSASMAQAPPDGAVFLPASGQRYPDGNGDVVHVGKYGYVWTCSPYDAYTVNYMLIYKTDMVDYEADRSYAYPVRCIRVE